MDKIIEIKNLSKSFGDKKVLEDINLYIRRGSSPCWARRAAARPPSCG